VSSQDAHADDVLRDLLKAATEAGALPRVARAPRPAQQERYDRVLAAAIETAREGGYDAVQMRTVAQRSAVSLATVYTYFTSRDNLVFRATTIWTALLRWQLDEPTTPEGRKQPLTRAETSTRMLRAMSAEPHLMEAWARGNMTSDDQVVESLRNVDWAFWAPGAEKDSLDVGLRNHYMLVNDVLFAGVVRWAFGQRDLDEVIESVARLAASADAASDLSPRPEPRSRADGI
jgi:AcrR family transcriptional regulator